MATLVSVVVPCHNEEENVPILADRVAAVFAGLPEYDYELLLVDDASTDGTRGAMEKAAAERPEVRPIHLAHNGGQSAAIVAGMRRGKGEFLLMLDGDLQNDPADFPRMLEELQQCDCVCGYRAKRKDGWLKRQASLVANNARRWWLQDDLRDAGCGTKGFRKICVQHMIPFNGMHRYFGVMMKLAGMRIVQIEVRHHPRQFGTSKYGIWDRLVRGLYDLLGVQWLRKRYVPFEVENGGEA